MRRTKEEAEQTRQKIFEIGLRSFANKGFAATTLGDIAGEAHLTRGAIYWHYRNKKELFDEIISKITDFADQLINETAQGQSPLPEKIKFAVTGILRRFSDDRHWREMQDLLIRLMINGQKEVIELMKTRQDDFRIRGIFDEAIRDGKTHADIDVFTAVFSIMSLVVGSFLQMTYLHITLTDQQIENISKFIARAFEPENQASPLDKRNQP